MEKKLSENAFLDKNENGSYTKFRRFVQWRFHTVFGEAVFVPPFSRTNTIFAFRFRAVFVFFFRVTPGPFNA